MNRLHVHVSVENLEASRRFYSALFGAEPSVDKSDYAKWMLDEPLVNFAISQSSGNAAGINHLGIQAETAGELEQLHTRLADARYETMEETGAKCCYAESDKHWAVDPTGVVWEMFHSMRQAETYGSDRGPG